MGEVLSVAAPPPDPVNNNTWWGKAKSMASGAKPEQKGGMEQDVLRGAMAMAGGLLKEAHPVVERVRSWLGDDDWEALGQAAHYARANLAKVVGRVPGALGTLLDVVGDLGLEDAGRLGAAIAKVASLLEEGDLQALEDTIGEILEAGLFGLTFLLPNIIIIIFILKAMVISGSLALVDRGVLKQDEAVIHYRNICAKIWRVYSRVFHAQEWEGLDNIPKKGGALIIYYHGVVPVDYCATIGEVWLEKGRCISSVVDRSLMEIPGLDPVREHFNLFPGTRESCIELLKDGSLLGIAPGGAREAYFGDSSYPILWGSRQGFATVAIAAGVPIIPVFTENIREATLCMSGRMKVGRGLWEYIYETTKMPLVPMYGLFPVKLRTHLGKPIYPTPGMQPEEMVNLTSNAVQEMIDQHQQLPGSVKRAVSERVSEAAAMVENLALGEGKKK